jgi:hypothetical protein
VEFRSGGLKLIAVTDESGHFSIATDLANGTLVASYPAFSNFVIDITARSAHLCERWSAIQFALTRDLFFVLLRETCRPEGAPALESCDE